MSGDLTDTSAKKRTAKPRYVWDESSGVTVLGKDGVRRQAIQLLVGPATYAFRTECGKLLVAALNKAGK